MTLLGSIEYAPVNVPVERRLQTLAVFLQVLCMTVLGPVCTVLLAYLLLCTQYYWLALLYALFRLIDGNPGSRGSKASNWVRQWTWWRYYRDYFPVKLIKTADLDPSRNYILAVSPHGIFATGGVCFFTEALNVSQVFPGIKPSTIILDMYFRMPGTRELLLALGGCSPSRKSLEYLLRDPEGGRAAVLVVGGAEEALLCQPGDVNIVLTRRKGFVKLALQNGVPLVPVIAFGENELYGQIPNPEGSWLRRAQEQVKHVTSFSLPLVIGRGFFQYTFGMLPRRRPVNVVVGAPIEVMRVEAPTDEQVDELHQTFTAALMHLFEHEKHEYLADPNGTRLVIH